MADETPIKPKRKYTKKPKVELHPSVYRVERFTGKIAIEGENGEPAKEIIEVIPFLTEPARVSIEAICSYEVAHGPEGGEWRGIRIRHEVPCYREQLDEVALQVTEKVKAALEIERRELIAQARVEDTTWWSTPDTGNSGRQ